MAVKEQERQDKELKKAKIKELAATNKLYKAKLVEEKHVAWAREKEEKAEAWAKECEVINAWKAARLKAKEAHDGAKTLQLS